MEILKDINIDQVINQSLKNSLSYSEYRQLVEGLVTENSTTGNEKTEDLAEYTKLNDRRMKRWDKTLKVPDGTQQNIQNFRSTIQLKRMILVAGILSIIFLTPKCSFAQVIPGNFEFEGLNRNYFVSL